MKLPKISSTLVGAEIDAERAPSRDDMENRAFLQQNLILILNVRDAGKISGAAKFITLTSGV